MLRAYGLGENPRLEIGVSWSAEHTVPSFGQFEMNFDQIRLSHPAAYSQAFTPNGGIPSHRI